MVKTRNIREADSQKPADYNKAEILLPKEPLFDPPAYRKVRSFLIGAERTVNRANALRSCHQLPDTLATLPELTGRIIALADLIDKATTEVIEAKKQLTLRWTDDWVNGTL